jgi:hypothetical protein
VYKQKNVQIPLDTFNDIVDLIHFLDDCSYLHNDSLAELYHRINSAIRKKRESMLFREVYAEIIRAKDDVSKDAARENYSATRQIYNRFN